MYTRLVYSLVTALALICIHAAPTASPKGELFSRTQLDGRNLNVVGGQARGNNNNRDRDRLLDLVSRKTDLMVKIEINIDSRRRNDRESVELKIDLSNMDRRSDAAKGILGRMAQAQAKGKGLDGDLGRLTTQLQGVQKEMDAVKAVMAKGAGDAPGKNSNVGAPGKNATDGAPGKNANIGAPGKNATVGAPGKNSTVGAPGKNSTVGAAGKNSTVEAPGKNSTAGASGNNSTVAAKQQ